VVIRNHAGKICINLYDNEYMKYEQYATHRKQFIYI